MFEISEINTIMQKVIDLFLIPKFKELKMEATGEWERSLEIEAYEESGTIRGRYYSQQLALGRRPGKMPPIKPIQDWAMAKFGVGAKEALGIAFAVAKKIKKEGTSWHQKGGSDLIEVLQEKRTIEFIESELTAIATFKVAENLRRNVIVNL